MKGLAQRPSGVVVPYQQILDGVVVLARTVLVDRQPERAPPSARRSPTGWRSSHTTWSRSELARFDLGVLMTSACALSTSSVVRWPTLRSFRDARKRQVCRRDQLAVGGSHLARGDILRPGGGHGLAHLVARDVDLDPRLGAERFLRRRTCAEDAPARIDRLPSG